MDRYEELVELARMCLRQARIAQAKDVAEELRCMAREYQDKASRLNGGKLPDFEEKFAAIEHGKTGDKRSASDRGCSP